MFKKVFPLMMALSVMAMVLSACGLLGPDDNGKDAQSVQQTAVMQTVAAVMTQQAFETLIAQATQIASQQSTPTPQQPTAVVTEVQNTPVQPTATQPLPT
ncbi:MAG: hypothetical protein N2646_01775, partial [Bellilinea sp.]|nr:hypothetical protein [Bellilinea sp.]